MGSPRSTFVAALLVACVSRDHGPPYAAVEPIPRAFRSSSMDPEAREAYELLRTASQFESAHVGVTGALSKYAQAFRRLVRSSDGRAAFLALSREESTVARLYAACGIYFVAPRSFDAAVCDLARRGGTVDTLMGCLGGRGERVVPIVIGGSIDVPEGQSIADLQVLGGMADIAGGYLPLGLLEDYGSARAPRGPVPRSSCGVAIQED